MSKLNWRRALVAAALCEGGLVSGRACRRADYASTTHFHLTNHIQEGITVQDFLNQGDKVGPRRCSASRSSGPAVGTPATSRPGHYTDRRAAPLLLFTDAYRDAQIAHEGSRRGST
jgi:hypothetical protein